MSECLVTGAAGFVGRHLCHHLVNLGFNVTALDINPVSPSPMSKTFVFVYGNVATGEGLTNISWEKYDVVFHLAAAGVKAVSRDWQSCLQVNLLGTLNLIDRLSKTKHVPTLVYTHTYYEDHISTVPALASNPYVLTKYATSRIIRLVATNYAGGVIMAKLFQIYGAGDAPDNLIPYVHSCLRKRQPAQIGSGAVVRDWLSISDLVEGLVACWHAGVPHILREYELGSGKCYSIKEVLCRLAQLLDLPESLLHFDALRDRGDLKAVGKAQRWPDNWKPRHDLTEGLKLLIASEAT